MKKIKWGVLSTARIGVNKVIPAMQQGNYSGIVAIGSRNLQKARKVADQHGIQKAYGSYEELLADPDIEAIYNPLPNHLHVEWTRKAFEAGKHVLCEKPIGLNAADAENLLETSKQFPKLKVMEAFMYRLHPQWKKTRELVKNGAIGDLKTIQSFFSYFNDDPGNIRNQADIGGGGLLDIGCYCISLSRFIFDKEPERVIGAVEYDPLLETDRLASGILDFGNGSATFTCSTQLNYFQRVNILGTKGRIEIEIPFNAPPDRPCRIWLQQGDGQEEIQFEICNQYTIQGDLFSLAILQDTDVPTPLEDALENMRVIDGIKQSYQKNSWIAIG